MNADANAISFSTVTAVELAATALLLLSKGEQCFHLVLANIDPPGLANFNLLQEAVKKDLLVVLMCTNEDDMVAWRTFEYGAFLIIQKPVTLELLKYLWQHVLREKIRNKKTFEEMSKVGEITSKKGKCIESIQNSREEDKGSGIDRRRTKGGSTNKVRSRRSGKKEEECDENARTESRIFKIIWTDELHEKFMDAVTQLGEGRCYPKDILEIMNVSGLTRMQVASHLQKCRHDKWKATEMCKSHPKNRLKLKMKSRQFGAMPHLLKKFTGTQSTNQDSSESSQGLETNSSMCNHFMANGKGGDHQMEKSIHYAQNSDENQNTISNDQNDPNKELATDLRLSSQQYGRISSKIHNATASTYSHNSSNLKPTSEGFFDFLPERDGVLKNFSGSAQCKVMNHSTNLQQIVLNFDQVSDGQLPIVPNKDPRGQRNV